MAAVAQMSEYRNRNERYDAQAYLRRLEALKGQRSSFESHWREVSEIMWPHADEFQGRAQAISGYGGGEKRTQKIFDATAAQSLGRFAAIMESINTPRSKVWSHIKSEDDELNKDPSAKRWFEHLTRIFDDERGKAKANFYGQMHEGYMSLGAFGGLPLFVGERLDGGLRYRYCHVNELYVEVDFAGRVDTVYRVWFMSARQAFQQWGDGAGEKVKQALGAGKPDQRFEFVHVVQPRKDVNPDSFGPDSKPYLSLYLAAEEQRVIEVGGFETMRYLYSRWTVAPSEVYERSPGMMAMPHARTSNEMVKTGLSAGHRAVNPPLLLPHEGIFGASSMRVRNVPGGLNPGGLNDRGEEMIKPLVSGMDFRMHEEMLEGERAVTRSWFLVDLFRTILEDPTHQRTATEVLQAAQEKGDLIAPEVGRLQNECLGPEVECVFEILARQGRIPPPPPVVVEAGAGYKIEYVSEAARLQKSRAALGIRNVIDLAVALAPLDPRAAKKVKLDEALEEIADYEGAPSRLIRTEEEIDALVAAEQEQQQAAQQLAMFQAGASGAKDATAALQQAAQAGQIRGAP